MHAIQRLDEKIILQVQSHRRCRILNQTMKFYTILGNGGFLWILLSAVMLLWDKTYRAGVASGLALTFGVIITNLGLKPFVARPRPYEVMENVTPLLVSFDPNSFPSGHTCAAFSAGIAWAVTLPNWWGRCAAILQALCMGYSRLYVGVHYPSDVIAGALVGTLCAFLAVKIV